MESHLRTIQRTELVCLKEIKSVCKNHNMKYCLAYGTMLGAVRHKGFIPWDDDLDIYMYYNDAQSLGKYINQDEFFLQTPKTDPQSPFMYYKLRKNNTKMIEEQYKNLNMHQGIWVDIFLCFNAAKFQFCKKIQYRLSQVFQTLRLRWYDKIIDKKGSSAFFITHLPEVIAKMIEKIIILLIRLLGSKGSSEVFVACNETFHNSFMKRSYLTNTDNYRFEDSWFTGPEEYSEYLIQQYGQDYMTPIKYGNHSNIDNVELGELK